MKTQEQSGPPRGFANQVPQKIDLEDSIPAQLHLTISIFKEPHKFTFDTDAVVAKVLIQVFSSDIPIQNPEAFGLCFSVASSEQGKKKKKIKDGAFRDTTKWLDEQYPLRYYVSKGHLHDEDTLILKIRNSHLSKSKSVNVLMPSTGVEVHIKYDYMTTIGETIRRLLRADDDEAVVDSEWALLLPVGRKDGLMLSLWMDPTRTLQSYDLYSLPGAVDSNQLRLLVLTKDPKELNNITVKIEENELEMWWVLQIKKNHWAKFRPNVNHKKFEKLKAQVRKGIPAALRGDVWPILTGARDLMRKGEYQTFREKPLPPDVEDRIKRDLKRTLPFHPYFQTEEGRAQLYSVLAAYANKEPEILYCQGMNFIVGVMLLTMNEEVAYWCFCALMTVYGMKEFFGDNVPLLSSSLIQFQRCIEIMNPEIWDHFEAESINLNLFATPWFLTLFAYDSQLEFLHRLWDIFFNEGFSIIFRTAMAILREGEDLIMTYDLSQMKDYFQYAPRQIIDPDLILNAAFKVPKCKFMHKIFSKAELTAIEGGSKVAREGTRSGMYHSAAISSAPRDFSNVLIVDNGTTIRTLKSKNPNGIATSRPLKSSHGSSGGNAESDSSPVRNSQGRPKARAKDDFVKTKQIPDEDIIKNPQSEEAISKTPASEPEYRKHSRQSESPVDKDEPLIRISRTRTQAHLDKEDEEQNISRGPKSSRGPRIVVKNRPQSDYSLAPISLQDSSSLSDQEILPSPSPPPSPAKAKSSPRASRMTNRLSSLQQLQPLVLEVPIQTEVPNGFFCDDANDVVLASSNSSIIVNQPTEPIVITPRRSKQAARFQKIAILDQKSERSRGRKSSPSAIPPSPAISEIANNQTDLFETYKKGGIPFALPSIPPLPPTPPVFQDAPHINLSSQRRDRNSTICTPQPLTRESVVISMNTRARNKRLRRSKSLDSSFEKNLKKPP